jgi:broad specificity phosphatase PhoE
MSERRLILIKHAMPEIKQEQASSSWHLSEAGRASCESLALALAHYQLSMIVSSAEPKAHETAEILRDRLNVPVQIAPGLHEHDRTGVPYLDNPSQWNALIEQFFGEPDNLVLGRETATAARDRFATALGAALANHGTGNLAVVAHGTVISLFIGLHNNIDMMSFWRTLGMPSFGVLQVPSFRIEQTVHAVSGGHS